MFITLDISYQNCIIFHYHNSIHEVSKQYQNFVIRINLKTTQTKPSFAYKAFPNIFFSAQLMQLLKIFPPTKIIHTHKEYSLTVHLALRRRKQFFKAILLTTDC